MENNWRYKSISNLTKKSAQSVGQTSYLIRRCSELFIKPLNEFSVEDMRIMIGQQIGLEYLIPLAVEQLTIDILAEGDFYPGDLLTAVVRVEKTFWSEHAQLLNEINELINTHKALLASLDIPSTFYLTASKK